MKRLVVAGALVALSAQVQADNLTRYLLGGTILGAAIVAINQSAPPQQQQNYDAPIVQRPQVVYQSNVQYLPGPPNQQRAREYPRMVAPPEESPRTKYIRECQRYGFSMEKCINIWDGPPVQEPSVVR
jgi:hypothetical protein